MRVALTGGIATGKTYVLGRFAARGALTIDADRLARDVVQPGLPAWREILQRFGSGIVTPDGLLDREKLATIVFDDPEARRQLETIIHPRVYQALTQWLDEVGRTNPHRIAIADIPLLFETGHERDFEQIIVVACSPEVQIQRVMARDGLTESEARQRLEAQWPTEEKMKRADHVIRTDGTRADTDRQVEEVYRRLGELKD